LLENFLDLAPSLDASGFPHLNALHLTQAYTDAIR